MAGNGKWEDNSYPQDNGRYVSPGEHTLQPSDHFKGPAPNGYLGGEDLMKYPPPRFSSVTRRLDDKSYLVKDKGEHFIRDLNDVQGADPKAKERPVVLPNSTLLGGLTDPPKYVFSGATTNINPNNNPEKQKIIDYGLSDYEEERIKSVGDYRPPLSIMHPFTRMIDLNNPNDHQIANLTSFNRYHLPVSDLEHRKAFRHLFFTRPECYICCTQDGKVRLSQQAEYDEDFNTSYSRMPYISKLLSPVYVSGTFGQSGIVGDNINYLLSNRCMGLAPSGATLSTQDTVSKSIQGYTVTPGMHYEGRQGATISVTFRDTKYLEIFEFIRMWMLYIWKIKYGTFAPSFNGYRYTNGFPDISDGKTTFNSGMHLHPFDRALDYTISMFDFVMDESDTFARYWCKYYGMYPIDVQIEGLTNSNNDALKNEMTVSVTFKYAYKIENTTKSLIEFNYNCGICNNMGQPTGAGTRALQYSEQFAYMQNKDGKYLKEYMGPGAGFVGTPFIVLMSVNKDILKDTDTGSTMMPCLRFSPITKDISLNQRINMGLESINTNSSLPVQSDLTEVKVAIEKQKAKEAEETGEMSIAGFNEYMRTDVYDKVDQMIEDPWGTAGNDVINTINLVGTLGSQIFGDGEKFDIRETKPVKTAKALVNLTDSLGIFPNESNMKNINENFWDKIDQGISTGIDGYTNYWENTSRASGAVVNIVTAIK